jgi:hypothetical protein
VDEWRQRLRDLNVRVLRLHKVLLDREHRAYETRHGPLMPVQLLHLLLNDAQFAWLRPLSGAMARIDEALDADSETSASSAESLFRAVHDLLRSDRAGAFETKYRAVLQESPDVVMAHADVIKVLPVFRPPDAPTQ